MATPQPTGSGEYKIHDVSIKGANMTYLGVFLLGGLGCSLRYLLQSNLNQEQSFLAWGTVLSNMIGCILIGALAELMKDQNTLLKIAVLTGFLGGLTTLSSFAFELMTLLKGGQLIRAALYWSTASVFSLAFVWLGSLLGGRG